MKKGKTFSIFPFFFCFFFFAFACDESGLSFMGGCEGVRELSVVGSTNT